ncbi:hypothetical protein D3Y57_14305 [Sphingomonas paeninsulae]|uniref:Uncharacterized protein n=1 Tax=Sphingomonas paeninsulae TaxID=2319844 RepID=A0A494TBW0_SPHPE|nr:hypothetical protein [Sphingomonas paeninsulae]AYJ86897.1 hypothetical protein D3Y57_14305 [Sphingomonas paeninsulae]
MTSAQTIVPQSAEQFKPKPVPTDWMPSFIDKGGWYGCMADGRVLLGYSGWGFTDEQQTAARAMISALSRVERDAIEHEIRSLSLMEA